MSGSGGKFKLKLTDNFKKNIVGELVCQYYIAHMYLQLRRQLEYSSIKKKNKINDG